MAVLGLRRGMWEECSFQIRFKILTNKQDQTLPKFDCCWNAMLCHFYSVNKIDLISESESRSVHGILQARTLEWVTVPFSRGSSQPRDWTLISCIVGRFFTSWATSEALIWLSSLLFYNNSPFLKKILLFLFFLTELHSMWDISSLTNSCPLPWKCGVLTTGPPGKSL